MGKRKRGGCGAWAGAQVLARAGRAWGCGLWHIARPGVVGAEGWRSLRSAAAGGAGRSGLVARGWAGSKGTAVEGDGDRCAPPPSGGKGRLAAPPVGLAMGRGGDELRAGGLGGCSIPLPWGMFRQGWRSLRSAAVGTRGMPGAGGFSGRRSRGRGGGRAGAASRGRAGPRRSRPGSELIV